MEIKELLELASKNKASDLHLIAGIKPTLRINGQLEPLVNHPELSDEKVEELVKAVLSEEQSKKLIEEKEVDFSYALPNGVRFRVNVYYAKGMPAASFRTIPAEIPSLEELNLPSVLQRFVDWQQGLVLITGPAGHGKSTTVAAILEEINSRRGVHIITIEDPIEYFIEPKEAIVSQREVGRDTLSWNRALRSVLREDPDVIFVGEMRDLKSIEIVLSIAETGHLVFSTLHTNSAAETIDRVVDAFPKGSQDQVRAQMLNTLRAVVSQRLIPTRDDNLVPAVEVLLSTSAVKNSIRENKVHMIDNIIQTSSEMGMIPLERSLAQWVKKGRVDKEVATSFAIDQEKLYRMLER